MAKLNVKVNKKILAIVGAVMGVLILAGSVTATVVYIRSIKSDYQNQLAFKDGTINSLNEQIAEIGPLVTVFELNYDVASGSIIEEQDLTPVTVPEKASAGFITDINDAVGQRYKTGLHKGDLLADTLVYPNDLTSDVRFLDVPLDQMPIHLEVGDYVDIRFQFSMGQDFIVMEHKEVLDINSNVITILADAAEVHVDNSMRIDQRYYASCKIYALMYVDGGVQQGTKTYYPVRYEQLATMLDDPNIPDDYDFDKYTAVDRTTFEEMIVSNIRSTNNGVDEEIAELMEQGISNYQASYEAARSAYLEGKGGGQTSSGSGGGYNQAGADSVGVMN